MEITQKKYKKINEKSFKKSDFEKKLFLNPFHKD